MKNKKFIIVSLAFALCFSIGAATGTKITAELKNQEIICNNKKLNKQVVVYKGTTYVPLKEFANLTSVKMDYKNGVVYLGDNNNSKTESQSTYNYANPAPLGAIQSIKLPAYVDYKAKYYDIEMRVDEVIRGDKAWEILSSASVFASKPSEKQEYIIVKMYAKVNSAEDGVVVSLSQDDFMCFSKNNMFYAEGSYAVIDNKLDAKLVTGSSTEGYIVFLVDKSDSCPKIGFGTNINATNKGIWFKAN